MIPRPQPPGRVKSHRLATPQQCAIGAASILGLAGVMLLAVSVVRAVTPEQEAKLLPADGSAGDDFGLSIAVEGEMAAIGAPWATDAKSGAVYVFGRTEGGWSQRARLLAPDGEFEDAFGWSVDLGDDTVVIGAPKDDPYGSSSGSAYVFTRTGEVFWTMQAKLLPEGGAASDFFGAGVALDGDTAIIGAQSANTQGVDSGSAYIFTRSGSVWTLQAELLPQDAAMWDYFGISVAIQGDTAMVGAPFDDDNGANSGSVYVFTRTEGLWAEQAKLMPADGASYDQFGVSIAIDGDTVIIGSVPDDFDGSGLGSAYVFTRAEGVWAEQAKLVPADGAEDDRFGHAVALEGDMAIVGAYNDEDLGYRSGSAYVFTGTGTAWSEQVKLLPQDAIHYQKFGVDVAIRNRTAVIGADGDDDLGAGSGSAYVIALNACSITITRDESGTMIHYSPGSSAFDVVTGYVSELLVDTDFSGAACLGSFPPGPAADTLPGPASADARYYLARGLERCVDAGYGESSLEPDPRDDLDDDGPCP